VAVYINKISNQQDPIEDCENLTIQQQIIEFIFLGLRQKDGMNILEFDKCFPY
jgi:HemN C-terminal region.